MSDRIETVIAGWIDGYGYDDMGMEPAELLAALKAARIAVVEVPEVAHKGPHDTEARFFRQVADRLDAGYGRQLGGSNVLRAVRDLLYRTANAAEASR